jgi:ribosomal protein S12 methylthiotransferase
MKRGSSMEKINNLLSNFRKIVPGIAIRTTLIVGYPGETKEDFEILKQWVKDTKFDRLGCFTYSHEENTGAYDLEDNIPQKTKNERLNEIMEIQSQISWQLNQTKIGKIFKVLIDRKRGEYYVGRTQFDSPDVDNEVLINAKSNFLRVGEYVNAKIIEASDFDLYAEVN